VGEEKERTKAKTIELSSRRRINTESPCTPKFTQK
jgi:hypothetical protein